MGKILLAGKEAQEGPSQVRGVVADGSPEHRVLDFELVKDRALGDRTLDLQYEFAADTRQVSKMEWEYDSNHGPLPRNRNAKILPLGFRVSLQQQLTPASGLRPKARREDRAR
jgi:hypothetical protein